MVSRMTLSASGLRRRHPRLVSPPKRIEGSLPARRSGRRMLRFDTPIHTTLRTLGTLKDFLPIGEQLTAA
jgi:hypothetical protein